MAIGRGHHRVVHARLADERLGLGGGIGAVDAQDGDPAVRRLVVLRDQRGLPLARGAPGGEEVEDQGVAGVAREREMLAGVPQDRQAERRGRPGRLRGGRLRRAAPRGGAQRQQGHDDRGQRGRGGHHQPGRPAPGAEPRAQATVRARAIRPARQLIGAAAGRVRGHLFLVAHGSSFSVRSGAGSAEPAAQFSAAAGTPVTALTAGTGRTSSNSLPSPGVLRTRTSPPWA